MDTLRQSGSEVTGFEFVFLLWFHIFESWNRYEAHSFTLTIMTHHVFYVLSLFLCFSLLHLLLFTVAFTRDLLCMCNLYHLYFISLRFHHCGSYPITVV